MDVKVIGFLESQNGKAKLAHRRRATEACISPALPVENLFYENNNLQMNKLRGDYSYCKRVFKDSPRILLKA